MSKYEIFMTFFTVIYGLMLAELFLRFHRLVKAGKKVKWHWLPLLAAWYLFLIVLKNWWELCSFQNGAGSMNILMFLAYGHLLLLLFLLVATVLPDAVDKEVVDLKSYYLGNHRYFWGLMTAIVVLSWIIGYFRHVDAMRQAGIANLTAAGVFLALLLVLTICRKIWVHSVLLVLFVIMVIIEITNKR